MASSGVVFFEQVQALVLAIPPVSGRIDLQDLSAMRLSRVRVAAGIRIDRASPFSSDLREQAAGKAGTTISKRRCSIAACDPRVFVPQFFALVDARRRSISLAALLLLALLLPTRATIWAFSGITIERSVSSSRLPCCSSGLRGLSLVDQSGTVAQALCDYAGGARVCCRGIAFGASGVSSHLVLMSPRS